MAKITIGELVFEGTVEELRELGVVEAEECCAVCPKVESTYVKVTDRKPKAGDYVKFNEDTYDVTAGKYYEVTDVDCDGDIEIVDDVGDEFNLYGEDFEVYEKVDAVKPDSLAFKGAEYMLVQRKAQPGDVVVFTESTSACVTNGKTYGPIVESRGGLGFTGDVGNTYDVYYDHYNRTVDNVKVYAPVAEARLKVGDYAKVVGSSNGCDKLGDIVKIVKDDGGVAPFENEHIDGSYAGWQDAKSLVKATDEEVAKALAPKLNIGDYVKIISAGEFGGVGVGEIGKVVRGHGSTNEYRVDKLDRSDHDYFTADKLEKVSAEEVEKALKEAKLAEQFAKLGRKPNDFKVGDVVRVIKESSGHEVETIGEVVEIDMTERPKVRALYNDGRILDLWSYVELIAPVESRVDAR